MTDENLVDSYSMTNNFSLEINQSLNRFMQGIKDESKFKRKSALEQMKKQLQDSFKSTSSSNSAPATLVYTSDCLKSILKIILNILNDQMEKCREIACEIITIYLENDSTQSGLQFWDHDMSSMTLTSLFQRLGGKDVKEQSEEIRLKLYTIAYQLIEAKTKTSSNRNTFEIHLTELVAILINSFNDNFPEVKKQGCACARLIAQRLASSNFHMQSENLIKPLLANMTHQHSRVRKDIVDCLSDVILHGNNKSVNDVISHLAQRLFDQASIVRMAVIKLAGMWLLELPDRYSFHYKLMPLLLTGFVDESNEIKDLAEGLWWDVGVKYEKENEQDLKDKSDFLANQIPETYPNEFRERRPNLGCRELMRLNASKIIPAILNDIGDWVEATRIKSIQLLYIIIWQAEKNVTQHLELVLQTLFKASNENLEIVQNNIFMCSRLIGHFTEADLTLKFVFKSIRRIIVPNSGSINILYGLLVGFGDSKMLPFSLIVESLDLLNEICLTTEVSQTNNINTHFLNFN
jgi:dynein assembly factor 5